MGHIQRATKIQLKHVGPLLEAIIIIVIDRVCTSQEIIAIKLERARSFLTCTIMLDDGVV